MPLSYLTALQQGDFKALARSISLVENEGDNYETLLLNLPHTSSVITVGITGPPGAGKSTLVNALTGVLLAAQKKIAILAVDPSSPFSSGSLLGDRIRMSEHFTHPGVFIRSLASRGALGGLHPKIIEISDMIKAAPFDYLFIETVGVGQSEVEIAGIADTTVVVVAPGVGDEIQTMKAGLMEIADIFAVNKADSPQADELVKHLRALAHHSTRKDWEIPVLKTVATRGEGISELVRKIQQHHEKYTQGNERKSILLAEKAYLLLQSRRMKDLHKKELQEKIIRQLETGDFNLYRFCKDFEI